RVVRTKGKYPLRAAYPPTASAHVGLREVQGLGTLHLPNVVLTPGDKGIYLSSRMPTLPTVQRFLSMASGNWVAASLHAAAVLGIADLLAEGPRSAGQLAQAAHADPDALRRLLRMLAAHGVFAEREDGRFEQTELSTLLRDDAAGSLRS